MLALVLFVLEAKFASHGILTAGGAVAMVLGAVLLVESPLPEMRIHLSTALAVTLPFALVTSFLVTLAVRARRSKVLTGAAGMVDEIGAGVHAARARRQGLHTRRVLERRVFTSRSKPAGGSGSRTSRD